MWVVQRSRSERPDYSRRQCCDHTHPMGISCTIARQHRLELCMKATLSTWTAQNSVPCSYLYVATLATTGTMPAFDKSMLLLYWYRTNAAASLLCPCSCYTHSNHGNTLVSMVSMVTACNIKYMHSLLLLWSGTLVFNRPLSDKVAADM